MSKYANEDIFRMAVDAGLEAVSKLEVVPMVVTEVDVLTGAPKPGATVHYVADGVCGFAWITVRPGNCSFARWLLKDGKGRKAYGGGVQWWISAFGQSMQKKDTFATAAAEKLRELGVKAYAGSRMD